MIRVFVFYGIIPARLHHSGGVVSLPCTVNLSGTPFQIEIPCNSAIACAICASRIIRLIKGINHFQQCFNLTNFTQNKPSPFDKIAGCLNTAVVPVAVFPKNPVNQKARLRYLY